jgi:hypothetical protein
VNARQRINTWYAPSCPEDHCPVDACPQDGVRRAHVIRILWGYGCGLYAESRFLHRRRRFMYDVILGSPAVLQREIVPLEIKIQTRYRWVQNAKRLLQELLAGLVALHYDDLLALQASHLSKVPFLSSVEYTA